LLALVLAVRAAAAQPTTADKTAVLSLYEEAKALMDKGEYALARDKLEEGKRLDPSTIGLQLRLADCYEKNHQPASAWTQYIEVAALAQRSGDNRGQLALDRAAALAKLVPKLAIIVSPEAIAAGLEIRRNGIIVGRALWGTAVPTDPGDYVIEAHYDKGKRPYRADVRVESAGATVEVRIPPPLEDERETPSANAPERLVPASATPALPAAIPALVPSPARLDPRRVGGIATTAIGVGGVLAGIGLGSYVIHQYTASSAYCGSDNACTQPGLDLRRQAINAEPASLVSLGVGTVAVIIGVVLISTSSTGSRPRAARSALVGALPSGVSLSW
jgi:hypothetical protein